MRTVLRPKRQQEGCAARARYAAPRGGGVELGPRSIEQIATRVAAILAERQCRDQPRLLSAGELAYRLGVARPWVYRHRELLGGVRLGSGPKAPWRFELEVALEAMRGLQGQDETTGGRR